MKALRNFSRIFVGLIFIFSGFVKVVDPIGFAYKFEEYFAAMHLDFLSGGALTFAVLMSVAELLIGIALTFNILPKITAWAVLLFMTIFTPLTLWLAIANPVSDCGCFGDALILTNWETFFKNVIIDIFVVIIFLKRKQYQPRYLPVFQWGLGVFFAIACFSLAFYCLRNLPVIDFRPYHIGANILDGMSVPESKQHLKDSIQSVFIYEKNGIREAFDITSVPTQESGWNFIEAQHNIIKKGYEPPIHDFNIVPMYIEGISPKPVQQVYVNLYDAEFIFSNSNSGDIENFSIDLLPDNSWKFDGIIMPDGTNIDHSFIKLTYLSPDGNFETFSIDNRPSSESGYEFLDAEYEQASTSILPYEYGEDITLDILEDENYTFLLIIKDVTEANTKHIERTNKIAEFCNSRAYNFLCLTGSNEEEVAEFIKANDIKYNFFNTDKTTLKTIIRSNPGLLLLKEGTILNKWSHRNFPDPEKEDLLDNLMAKSISEHQKANENNISLIYILALLLFMSIFNNIYNWLAKSKYIRN